MSIAADFIKRHEGCKLTAYQDQGGIWTIGYGHTGPEVHKGLVWTQAQAEIALSMDVDEFSDDVKRLLKRALSENSLAALISFAFNLGAGALASSTLLVKVNQGDDLNAAKEFQRWDHIGQQENKGLLLRRLREATLYLEGV